jgi:hypothetical protein
MFASTVLPTLTNVEEAAIRDRTVFADGVRTQGFGLVHLIVDTAPDHSAH